MLFPSQFLIRASLQFGRTDRGGIALVLIWLGDLLGIRRTLDHNRTMAAMTACDEPKPSRFFFSLLR